MRAAALGTVAAGAMVLGYGRSAQAGPDACITVGNVATCQGNQSAGIAGGVDFPVPPVTTLNVNNLNQAIAPAAGDTGIDFTSLGDITIVSDTGPFAITTTNGYGIYASSANGSVSVTATGDISVQGSGFGIYASAGNGGGVTLTHTGSISTQDGDGIDAESLGAGAGDGSVTVTQTGTIATTGSGDVGIDADSDNGPVTVIQTGTITTQGGSADGIEAYSGSGTVIAIQTGTISTQNNNAEGISAVSDSGNVIATQTGTITTQGNSADGIVARSASGNVNVTKSGLLSTQGSNAEAIYAYSNFGAVTVTQTGTITTQGPGSDGIFANSNTGTIGITLNGGSITSAQAEGVQFANGVTNTLTINNTVTASGATFDIVGGSGNETIENFGTFTTPGDINLGIGTNAFNNNGGAIFNSGTSVDLGAGNLFTNAGTFSPGAVGALRTTVLTGNINQTASGIFQVDVDSTAGTSDLLNVNGTANLAGNVNPQIINPAFGPQSNLILSATGGTTNNGLGLLASPALQASLTFPNANDVVLNTNIDFLAPGSGLNQNQTNLANNLNAILGSGGGTVGPVLTALLNGVTDLPSYLNALNQLIPEGYLNAEATALFAAEEFNSNLLSCPQAGQGYTAVSQGECMWVRYDGRWLDRDSTRRNIGYEEDTYGISGGGQVAVAPNWYVGIAAAYQDSDLDTDANASADTDRYMLGGVIKYQSGPVLAALAGSFGSGDVDMARRLNFGGFAATARSQFDVDHVGATFHAAYLMDRSSWYAKPFVDVNVTHIDRDSVRETGAGAANLNVSGSDETYFSVTPALELGTTIDRGDGRAIRPYVRAGVTFYGDTDQSLTASFAGASAAAGGFTTTSEFDDIFADIAAGVTLFHGQTGTVSAGYEGRFSDDTDVHGFFVKGTRTF